MTYNRYGNTSCRVAIGSVTHAMKAQRILENNMIMSKVEKLTYKNGCTYGLSFPCEHKNNVDLILNKNGIKIKGYV